MQNNETSRSEIKIKPTETTKTVETKKKSQKIPGTMHEICKIFQKKLPKIQFTHKNISQCRLKTISNGVIFKCIF